MIKKLLLTGLMCLPMVAHAEDNKYPIKIPHIYTKEQWEHSTAPGPGLVPISYNEKDPKLSLEEQLKLKRAIDLKTIDKPLFWTHLPQVNNDTIQEFVYNLKFNNNSFSSIIKGSKITILTKKIFVKTYDLNDTMHSLHECPNTDKYPDLYGSYCEEQSPDFTGYQEYIVPINFSFTPKSGDISLSSNIRKIDKDGEHIYPNFGVKEIYISIDFQHKIFLPKNSQIINRYSHSLKHSRYLYSDKNISVVFENTN